MNAIPYSQSLATRLIVVRQESPEDQTEIEALATSAFGPGRFSRAAFRLREGVVSDPALCFVAELDGVVVGSVKQTPVLIGGQPALVLGPLVVDPEHRKYGIGRELMNRTLFEAQRRGHGFVVLVGDLAYYQQFGFERVAPGRITFPGPADPMRILSLELIEGVAANHHGQTTRYSGWQEVR